MKKIFFISTFFMFILTANSFAVNFHADSSFNYSRNWSDGDGKSSEKVKTNIFGMILNLGITFQRDFTVTLGGAFLGGKHEDLDMFQGADDSELTMMGFLFEFEYVPFIPALFKKRIKWFISFGTGYVDVNMKVEFPTFPSFEQSDNGVPVSVQTGIIIQAAQNFAPFIKVGWQRVYYLDEWKEGENDSLSTTVGVRYYFLTTKKINDTF